ncbi:hypothetical protein MNKW57_31010 [Biformimicrobium ophioploci]|uniref:Uncharacterized protein n=2 Tax=Biformimicrobium ophioploci TaxID=3036711 RepID=A0ABQ6M356_9GAMM|nr:hypothetical protein MNKW57_31010 [Microbulbifer sp. NKW57]
MITEDTRKLVDCPCGCGRDIPKISGSVENGNSKTNFYAYLMDEGDGPNLWLMLQSGPWFEDGLDCAIVVRSVRDEDGLTAYLKGQRASPWKDIEIPELKFLTREEVMAQEGGKAWVFRVHDEITHHHREISRFMWPDA